MRSKIVDLQARSMRDNLLFFNIPETAEENKTKIIHDLLEQKLQIEDARNSIKIDRSHRIGRKREVNQNPRPIVVKFNYRQDRENVRRNASKLKGTRIGISEQFPEEIESEDGKQAIIVKDKLIIDGQVLIQVILRL